MSRLRRRGWALDRLTLEFGDGSRSILVLLCVPTGEQTCRLEWLMTVMPSKRPIDGTRVSCSAEEPLILMQDRAARVRAGGLPPRWRPVQVQRAGRYLHAARAPHHLPLRMKACGRARAILPQRRVVPVRA